MSIDVALRAGRLAHLAAAEAGETIDGAAI